MGIADFLPSGNEWLDRQLKFAAEIDRMTGVLRRTRSFGTQVIMSSFVTTVYGADFGSDSAFSFYCQHTKRLPPFGRSLSYWNAVGDDRT